MIGYFLYKSELGRLRIKMANNFLIGLDFTTQEKGKPDPNYFGNKRIVKQLDEYFSGKRKKFDLPIKFEGTKFQQKVWAELLKIPYGKTSNYSEIAKKIKNPKAVRAVGTAIGQNPIGIIVPCHRVILKDGKLGGFAWGSEIKKKLLKLESGSMAG
jgi:methylated-DNA-[protein]-cysteine S-methyltransferase